MIALSVVIVIKSLNLVLVIILQVSQSYISTI